MNSTTLEALAERVQRLERTNRRWRLVGTAVAGLLSLLLLTGATIHEDIFGPKNRPQNVPEEVWAKRFVLVGPDGKPRAQLGERFLGLGLHVFDGDGNARIALEVMHANRDIPKLILYDQSGTWPRVMADVQPEGTARLRLLKAPSKDATMNAARAELLLDADGSPSLVFLDESGRNPRARFTLLSDGSSTLFLWDANGTPRAVFGIASSASDSSAAPERRGQPLIALLDERGRIVWKAP